MQMQRIERQQLSVQVLDKLRDLVLNGQYPIGSRLPTEPKLMESLGVGRSTIREAVQTLSHMGVLEVRQGSGTYVRALPSDTEPLSKTLRRMKIAEVHEARLAIEVEIAYLAAQRRTPDHLFRMRDALRRRAEAANCDNDKSALADADLDFHITIAEACGNPILENLYRSFSVVVHDAIVTQFREAGTDDTQTENHEELYRAIETQDAEHARETVRSLLLRASDIIQHL
jgi:DNA-binding FadR family transcriptional regulator